jgi:hypothetical protein
MGTGSREENASNKNQSLIGLDPIRTDQAPIQKYGVNAHTAMPFSTRRNETRRVRLRP